MSQQYELFEAGIDIYVLPEFQEQLKNLPNIKDELIELRDNLWENPGVGTHLGYGIFKIRLPVKSENRGKSFGLRVIYVIDSFSNKPRTTIYLMLIYDKRYIKDIPRSQLILAAKENGLIS